MACCGRRRQSQPQPSKGCGGRQESSTTAASKINESAAPSGAGCWHCGGPHQSLKPPPNYHKTVWGLGWPQGRWRNVAHIFRVAGYLKSQRDCQANRYEGGPGPGVRQHGTTACAIESDTYPAATTISSNKKTRKEKAPEKTTKLESENEPRSPDHAEGRHTKVWVPHEMKPQEMELEPPGEQSATVGVQIMRRVSIAEQGSCCQSAVGVELLAYQCSTVMMAQGGAERGACMLKTVLESGPES